MFKINSTLILVSLVILVALTLVLASDQQQEAASSSDSPSGLIQRLIRPARESSLAIDEDEDDEQDDDDDDDDQQDDDDDDDNNNNNHDDDDQMDSSGRQLAANSTATAATATSLLLRPKSQVATAPSGARSLGLALLLAPLIGITIKKAIIRGLLWALVAYALNLFFPSLLSSLGLGTGLVGFARQMQSPSYTQQLLVPHLRDLQHSLPTSLGQLVGQYGRVLAPIVESIKSIPEGHCRFRAVCETGAHLIRQSRSLQSTIQRLSATVYLNFGSDYAKAWLDGIVQSDCNLKYPQCSTSPFSIVAARLAQTLGARNLTHALGFHRPLQMAAAAQQIQLQQPALALDQQLNLPTPEPVAAPAPVQEISSQPAAAAAAVANSASSIARMFH